MKGKVAIVTGGAGGIGSAVCRAFAGEGVEVAVAHDSRHLTQRALVYEWHYRVRCSL